MSGEKLEDVKDGSQEERSWNEREERRSQNMNGKEKAKTGMEIGVLCLCMPTEIQSHLPSVSMPKGTWGHSYPPTSGQISPPPNTHYDIDGAIFSTSSE